MMVFELMWILSPFWIARRTSSSLTKSTAALLPFVDGATGLLTGSTILGAGATGAAYMLPASASICGSGFGNGVETDGSSIRLPARKRSTIAAISCRSILPPATTGAAARIVLATVCRPTAGRTLFTGRVSNAMRLMSIKCNGETLSDVTLPPHEPQPNVIDGGNAVEKPIAPCVVGVLTVMREAGISAPNCTAASRERV